MFGKNESNSFPRKIGSAYLGNGITVTATDHGDNISSSIQFNFSKPEAKENIIKMLNDTKHGFAYIPISKSAYGQINALFSEVVVLHNTDIPFRSFIPKEPANVTFNIDEV